MARARKQAVIKYAREHPHTTITDIAVMFDYNIGSAYNVIRKAGLSNPNKQYTDGAQSVIEDGKKATQGALWDFLKRPPPVI